MLFFISLEPAVAQLNQIPRANPERDLYTIWLVIAGSLVFFMNAGFAMLESGLCQAKNATNVLAKNLVVFGIASLAFWLFGFGLMFSDGNSWLGQSGFLFQAFEPPLQNSSRASFNALQVIYPGQPWMVVFFFQLVFAGTAATIVSGAMAERVKFWAFFSFCFCLIAFSYPLTGRWAWHPNGWLVQINFLDFAGSTVVHSVGGMAGLVGAILIGPRRGWQGFNPDETVSNNIALSTLGCLILWLGWFGFNGGSAKAIAHVPHIVATTMLAGASGGIFVLLLRGIRTQKPALSLVINGILGGLVSITATSMYVSLAVAVAIGAIGSLWIILIEKLLEELNIDDPVGAIPVHLGCGIWGTLAAGLFAHQVEPYINQPIIRLEQILAQIVGIMAINLTTLILSSLFWLTIGLAIYGLESLNHIFNSASEVLAPVSPANVILDSKDLPHNVFHRYLYLARRALRVSQQQEAIGSDGIFFQPTNHKQD